MLKEITNRVEHFTEEVHYVKILESDYDYLQRYIYKLETEEAEREEELQCQIGSLYEQVDEVYREIINMIRLTNDEMLTEKLIVAKRKLNEMRMKNNEFK